MRPGHSSVLSIGKRFAVTPGKSARDLVLAKLSENTRYRGFECNPDLSPVYRRGNLQLAMFRLLLWCAVAITSLCLLAIAKIIAYYDWRLWPAVRRARREIGTIALRRVPHANVFSSMGPATSTHRNLWFLIRTHTDKERDTLRIDPDIYQQFTDALLRAGYPPNSVPLVHFGIESQETVDRDYGGSWREASEMP